MRPLLAFLLLLCSSITAHAQTVDGGVVAGRKIYLRQLVITGNRVTRRSIILRELSVQEGRSIAVDSIDYLLKESQLRLLNVSLFTMVDVRSVRVSEDTADWQVNVKERWYIIPKPAFQLADRNFNVWWKEQNRDASRANFGLTVTDKNFRGNLELLSATVQVGYTQKIMLDYIRPYLDKQQRHGIGFSFSTSQSGELAYATDSNKLRFARLPGTHIIRQYDGGISYTYRPAYAVRHTLQL